MTQQFTLVSGLMLAGLISQVIARAINRTNFYDEVLCQNGHDLDHLIPPRDLRSWQNLPISALANFKPVTISDQSEQALSRLIEQYPYRHFPVIEDGRRAGIRESQAQLIQSSTGTLAITDESQTRLLGIVTLHDLLRAQLAVAEREGTGNE